MINGICIIYSHLHIHVLRHNMQDFSFLPSLSFVFTIISSTLLLLLLILLLHIIITIYFCEGVSERSPKL